MTYYSSSTHVIGITFAKKVVGEHKPTITCFGSKEFPKLLYRREDFRDGAGGGAERAIKRETPGAGVCGSVTGLPVSVTTVIQLLEGVLLRIGN